MSSKNKNQKPASSKPDAENGEDTAATQDVTNESASDADQQPDSADQPDIADPAEQPETPAVIETVAEELAVDAKSVKLIMDGLATRLTKLVNAIAATAKPDTVHALHKVEMIVGSLKVSLTAAIEACEELADESLKADFQSLLAIL